jgi:hypothetical protein
VKTCLTLDRIVSGTDVGTDGWMLGQDSRGRLWWMWLNGDSMNEIARMIMRCLRELQADGEDVRMLGSM